MKDDRIKPLALKLVELRKKRDALADQLKDMRAVHYLDILELSQDKEEAKKQFISNEQGREIALTGRLKEEPEYQRLLLAFNTISTDIEITTIELEHERNWFKVWYVEQLKELTGNHLP